MRSVGRLCDGYADKLYREFLQGEGHIRRGIRRDRDGRDTGDLLRVRIRHVASEHVDREPDSSIERSLDRECGTSGTMIGTGEEEADQFGPSYQYGVPCRRRRYSGKRDDFIASIAHKGEG